MDEFTAEAVRNWISAVGAEAAYIMLGSPVGSAWENGFIESFNAKLRDELHKRRSLMLDERGPNYHRPLIGICFAIASEATNGGRTMIQNAHIHRLVTNRQHQNPKFTCMKGSRSKTG